MLKVEQLHCARAGQPVLQNVSFTLAAGEVIGVLGANGAGKSTLLATLAGEIKPASGQIIWQDQAISTLPAAMAARQRAVLPQAPTLAFDLDVADVIATGAYPFPELAPEEVNELAQKALAFADAQALQTRRYLRLSGGEQQRIQLARVLVQVLAAHKINQSALLLLDEPIASLDPKHQLLVLRAVRQLASEYGVAVLLVLHDVNLAASLCDRLLLLAQGRVAAYGSPHATLNSATLQAVYDTPATVITHPQNAERLLVLFDL